MKNLKKDREAQQALNYLILKLSDGGLPENRQEWDLYRKHIDQISAAIKDSDKLFVVGKKRFQVSNSWVKQAHKIVSATTEYFSDGVKEAAGKGGGSDGQQS